jgi:hypothetical protein
MFYNFKIPSILLIATIISTAAYTSATAHTVQSILLIPFVWLGVFLAGLVIAGVLYMGQERQDALTQYSEFD